MEQINKILESELKDMRGALNQGKEPARSYKKESARIYKPTGARFKLVVWFNDGNTRYFYSFDNIHEQNTVHRDEWTGIKKLVRLLNTFEGKYKNAIVYATMDPDNEPKKNYSYEMVKRDRYGNEKLNKFVNFVTLGKNVILDVPKMKQYGNFKI